MSFMDAMKKVEKTNVEAGVPKVNPLLAKLNAGKTNTGEGAKKPNPLLKPKATAPVEEAEKTIQQKAVEEATAIIKAEETKVEEEVKQDVTPVVADEAKEESEEITIVVPKQENVVEEEPVVAEEVKPEPEAEVEEVKEPKKRGKRGSKKAKEPKVETKEATDETVEVFTTRISYEDAVAAISSPFSNEEFEMLKEEITLELNDINITEDMNSITAKAVNAQLAGLYQKVWFDFQAAKTLYDNLSQKDNGLIDMVKFSSIGDGTNDAQRKKAGIEACMRYTSPGATEPVNLFELLAYAREQYYFFKSVMDHLSYKKDVMISMNAALKIEDKVLGSGTLS